MFGSPLGGTAYGDAGDDAGLALHALVGHLVITGYDAGLRADRSLEASVGHLVITGHDAGLSRTRRMTADTGHLVVTGHAAGPHILPAETGHLVITGYDPALLVGHVGASVVGHLIITGYDATLSRSRILVAETGHLVISGYDVGGVISSRKFDLINALCIRESDFDLVPAQNLSVLGSGGTRGEDLAPARWVATLETRAELHADINAIKAEINLLDGVRGTFYCWDPKAVGPRADPSGTILGASTVLIASVAGDQISVKGCPAGYVLSKGDLLSFDFGTPKVRALHQVGDTVTADGGGTTPLFRVRPAPFPGTVADLAVTLIRPSAEMYVVAGSLRRQRASARRDVLTFEAEQVLA